MYAVLKYIHEHIAEELSLSAVAESFGYSKWHFCARFHEYTGKTFVKYVRHFRLHLATLAIMEGKKITDVATSCGYDSIGGFNKAFLAEFGCYPMEYRKNCKDALLYYERRKHMMFQLNGRCELLRKAVTEKNDFEDYYCLQHRVYYTLGVAEARSASLSESETVARGIVRVLDSFLPVIEPAERIVGFNFPDIKYPERYDPADSPETRLLMQKNGISEQDIQAYWAKRETAVSAMARVELSRRERDAQAEWAAISRCIDSNHTVLGYEDVLRLGFDGLLKKAERFEEQNGSAPLYTAVKQICRSAAEMGEKYARHAQSLKASGEGGYDPNDLERIIRVCKRVPRYPAETLEEAVQSLWFAHIINTWEDYINANSLGRLDQILYPYYKADIESGRITKEEAFELICCLWLKLYRSYDVQQSAVGGCTSDGEDAVNELSYMMLDATEQLDFVRCLSVRYGQKTDKAFLKRALEVVGHMQKGVPFFFNDDVMIPALQSKGVETADARNYTQIGCVETVIPGKANPHAVTGETNLLKALEYVLMNGYSMMYPEMKNGCESGSLDRLDTFEKFYDAVLLQIREILDMTCNGVKKWRDSSVFTSPKPYKSLLTEGCLEKGRDFNDAGAVYDYYQIMLGGVPNLADSLEVIRQFVYRDKIYTLSEVRDILLQDFPDEAVRQTFINKAAKFGNDIDSVDSLAVSIVDHSCDMLDDLSTKYGLSFHAQPFTYLWMIDHGKHSAASPDGRRKGENIAYSVSPMQGRDFNGLTALLNSIAKFSTERTPGTTSAIVEIDPKLFTDRNIDVLVDILRASSAKGLQNVQFNTIDADMLMDAKNHPEKYNNLAVRVSGFSQKFNLLSSELQDHIIARTKHTCL